ncbi:MAG: acyl-CoA dehydrogenase [Euryarchaeota archaeon]|nr:acyl-CoA dehydrogenase [Euryarchaeota archaeon]
MDFGLTAAQEEMRARVREFAERRIAPVADRYDRHSGFPEDVVKGMAELGLLGLTVPGEYGGTFTDTLSYVIAVEEVSRVCGGFGLLLAAHNSLGNAHIAMFGSEQQKRKYLPPIASGQSMSAWGLTEAGAGSDAGGTATTAVLQGDRYILNGSKLFITSGNVASTFVIMASTDRSKGTRGISAFIVERGTPGFRVGELEDKLGVRASSTAELFFDNAPVPRENLMGKEGEGFKQALANLDGGRISIAAFSLGMARGILDGCLRFLREPEGARLARSQAAQFQLARIATETEAARLLVYRCAHLKDRKLPYTRESAMAKLFASETASRNGMACVQLMGPAGLTRQHAVERLTRDAKLAEIGEGTSEIQKLVISRQLGLG